MSLPEGRRDDLPVASKEGRGGEKGGGGGGASQGWRLFLKGGVVPIVPAMNTIPVFTVDFEQVEYLLVQSIDVVLVFSLLTLNILDTFF